MARQIKLSAQSRAGLGRSAVRKIKTAGLVPGVVYGAKQQVQHVQLNARELHDVLAHATGEHFLVELEIAGEGEKTNRLALIQEVQHHPLKGSVLHIDFHAVSEDEKIHASVPIETVGEPNGVKNFGGLLELPMHTLEVECFPRELPDIVTIDVSALNVGEAIHVRDVKLPAGVTARGDQDLIVIRVSAPTTSEPTPQEAAAAGPEVLKEKKAEEKKDAK